MGISSELVFPDSNGDISERLRVHLAAPTLTVSSLHCDTTPLLAIQKSLRNEALVGGRSAFGEYCELVASRGARGRRTLDIVDHATAGHVATLAGRGDYGIKFNARWLVDETSGDERHRIVEGVRSLVESEAVVKIRLLGCRTGCATGSGNLRELSVLFNIEVLGTPWPIHGSHFKRGTFCSCLEGMLVRARPSQGEAPVVSCQAMPMCTCA